jgi:hypothetical protein
VVALLGLGVVSWRRFARAEPADRRTRRVWGWVGASSVLFSLMVAVLLIANTGVARDPAPAMLNLLNGSF